ncbi:hypothetical protein LOTGIDRAFT_162094 [Lottia gigantea]|uniref:Uncharacterized protein n=1 Tax=Lottia gigantea TaxID=225164 RepID=V4AI32_LOTGI|nr:hypothetical protein LOTGIDRAFT_162094 [Lottia gigantea]ESO93071.1 hypothetical protein LOTGIDRAFT_162094 [Lottia gigantea]
MLIITGTDSIMIFDDCGFSYRNIVSDQRVPELFYQEFETELLFKRSERPISRIRPNSVLNSLLHSIRSYPLLGRLKPCFYPREHLVTSVSRRSRTLDERRAKSFLSSCVRSILADLATIRIDDDIESSLKYGQLMDESILQVMLLNPMLDREQDKWIVRDAIFQHVNYQIGAARRRQRQNSFPEYSSTYTSMAHSRDTVEDHEDFQVVPDIDDES